MSSSYTQIFFCKPPVAGKVKTRLGNFLGMERARDIYREILQRVVGAFDPGSTVLFSAGDEKLELLHEALPAFKAIEIQVNADLGLRMADALHRAAGSSDHAVLLAGTDIPLYSPETAEKAAQALEDHDLVLGPTPDGGYYLVGVSPRVAADKKLLEDLFADIPWSTPEVYALQTARARELGLKTAEMETIADLDTMDDLLAWKKQASFYLQEHMPDIRAVLPVYNEAENLEFVLQPLFESGYFTEVICADNNSSDGSREIAAAMGARVTLCTELGYGATCLQALKDIQERGGCDVVLFTDADGADDPTRLGDLIRPLTSNESDFTLGVRAPELAEKGALLPQARFGNWLSTFLMKILWGYGFGDLGPYRALRWEALRKLKMDDRNFGWTVQMQIRAIKQKLRIAQIKVAYRKRHAGNSKVTASLKGAVAAGRIILWTVFQEYFLKK